MGRQIWVLAGAVLAALAAGGAPPAEPSPPGREGGVRGAASHLTPARSSSSRGVSLDGRGIAADAPGEEVFTVQVYPVAELLVGAGEGQSGEPPERELARLVDLIRTVVRPDSWDDPRASIAARPAGHLTVSQTAHGHAAVRRLLDELHRLRTTRITIRTRQFTYHQAESLSVIASAMHLDRPGPARLILAPDETATLVARLARRPDVEEITAPTLTVASGRRAHVSVGTETILSTRWERAGPASGSSADAPLRGPLPVGDGRSRAADNAEQWKTVEPFKVMAFEGNALLVEATASADRTSVILQVSATATLLGGGRSVADDWGRIDLPEFAASTARVAACVPNGHALLVGGMSTRVELGPGEARTVDPLRQRRNAAVLLLLVPSVEGPQLEAASADADHVPHAPPGVTGSQGRLPRSASEDALSSLNLASLAAAARMRRWAPGAAADEGERPSARPSATTVTISSADGLITLELNLAEGDLRTPTVKEWLRRLLERPGLRLDAGGNERGGG